MQTVAANRVREKRCWWSGLLTLAWILLIVTPTCAEVRLPSLFGDGMVLQRDRPVPIYGSAADGEAVTVQFRGQEHRTTATAGRWQVELASLGAGGPDTLIVKGANNTVELKNVLVGDVWLCSGQSNMVWPVQRSANPEQVKASANFPQIRLFQVANQMADQPLPDVKGSWHECRPETVIHFSAVGYHFGRTLHDKLQIPIGLIQSAVGGSAAEAWIKSELFSEDPNLKRYLTYFEQDVAAFPERERQFQEQLSRWEEKARELRQAGKEVPPKPRLNSPKSLQRTPSGLYNGMLRPLQPFAIRGVIWYQGEANVGRAYAYPTTMKTLIENWRQDWQQPDLPFFLVQLAPFMKKTEQPSDSAWAELREAQRLLTKLVPNTGLAVITDVGEENDIHPQQKQPVGERLARLALRRVYQQDILDAGPTPAAVLFNGAKAEVTFDSVGDGLQVNGTEITGFTLAGDDGQFYNATAQLLDKNRVVVTADQVAKPVSLRYGWANFPLINLSNSEGLPAGPFRTDDLPLTTTPKN